MDDGTRTHDDRNHNPGLYQLSYTHHRINYYPHYLMARLAGLEPATSGLEGRCSIQLSYRRLVHCMSDPSYRRPVKRQIGRGRGIRTPDPLLPKQMRYQTAPCPAVDQPAGDRHIITIGHAGRRRIRTPERAVNLASILASKDFRGFAGRAPLVCCPQFPGGGLTEAYGRSTHRRKKDCR